MSSKHSLVTGEDGERAAYPWPHSRCPLCSPGRPFAWAEAGVTQENKHWGGEPLVEGAILPRSRSGVFWGMSQDKRTPSGNLFRLPSSIPAGQGDFSGPSHSEALPEPVTIRTISPHISKLSLVDAGVGTLEAQHFPCVSEGFTEVQWWEPR